jgi:hypothetical protein
MPGYVAWSGGVARRWLPRALGLLIALELGLLTPLACVFHCFLEARAERPAIAWFLCGAHHAQAGTIARADAPATIAPRAFFELLAMAPWLLPLVAALALTLALRSVQRRISLPFPPPTPPPRPAIP